MTRGTFDPAEQTHTVRHPGEPGVRAMLTAMAACVGGASLHVGLALDLRVASAYLAIATLAVVALLAVLPVRIDALSAGATARAVFVRGFAVLGSLAIGVVMLDQHVEIAPGGLRAMLVAAVVFPCLSGVVLARGQALSRARRAVERERGAVPERVAFGLEMPPASITGVEAARELVPVLVAVLVSLTALVADGVARAFERSWSGARTTVAALALGAGIAWLTSLLVRWVDARLALEHERAELAAERRASKRVAALQPSVAALEAHAAAGETLAQAFERDGRGLASDQNQLAALVSASRTQDERLLRRTAELATQLDRARHSLASSSSSADEHAAQRDSLETALDMLARAVLEDESRGGAAASAVVGRAARGSRALGSGLAELVALVRALDESAGSASALAREAVARAEQGATKVAETSAGMEAIRAATQAAEGVIRGLGERTREIGGILDVIDDVGDQTSLLALNAAIIAAQAGEQGRAFSVVAEEIRDLADRVLASTKEIGGLIRAVQSESEHAIGAIEAGSAAVRRGVERSAEAGETLVEMARASRETGERVAALVSGATSLAHALGRASDQAGELDGWVVQLSDAGPAGAAFAPTARRELDGLRLAIERRIESVRSDQRERVERAGDELAVAANGVREIAEQLAVHARSQSELARAIERNDLAVCAVADRSREWAERERALRPLLGELGARFESGRESRGVAGGFARATGDDT